MTTVHGRDIDIAYQEHGQGDALLLIHGGMMSGAEWQPQIAPFAERCRVIAADVRGHGASGRGGYPYSIAQWAGDLVALLDALGIERAFVCGHSMGGTVAQQMAADFPGKVRALVIAESNYGTGNDPVMRFAATLSTAVIKLLGAKTAAKAATAALSGSPAIKDMVSREMAAHTDDPRNLFAILDAMNAYDGRANLTRIQCPTLVLHGADFRMGHKQHQEMAAAIPGARLVTIPAAGHGVNWDNTPAFNAAVLEFLAAHTGL